MDKKQTQPKQETRKQKPRRERGFWSNPWSSSEVEVDDGIWHGPNPQTHDWQRPERDEE